MRKTTNDFSNKSGPRRVFREPGLPNFKSLLFGILIGIFGTTLAIFTFATSEITLRFPSRYTQHNQPQQPQNIAMQAAAPQVPSQATVQPPPQAQLIEAPAAQEPRFDFYTELAKNTTETMTIPPAKESSDLNSNQKPINGYLVQAGGSFKRNVDADAIKAKLSLNGFEAKVEPIKLLDGEQRYRILLGPLKAEKNAKSLQQQLKSLDIESVLVVKYAAEKHEG